MAESTEFKSLAQFVAVIEHNYAWGNAIEVKYTSPNYQDPKKEFSVRGKEAELSAETITKLTDMSIGDKFCLTTKKDEKNPNFNVLVNVSDAKDAPERSATQYKSKSSWNAKAAYDDTAIAVGAAWKDAIEILKAGLTVADVAEMAAEVVKAKMEQEVIVRANKAKTKTEASKTAEKPLSALQQAKLKKEQAAKTKPEARTETETESTAELEDEDIPF